MVKPVATFPPAASHALPIQSNGFVGLRSPFEGHAAGERPTRGGDIGVRITAGVLPCVLQFATWPSGRAGLAAAVGVALACSAPSATGKMLQLPHGLLVRSGPEEFLLIADDAEAFSATAMRRTIVADTGSVTDLGHARCRITIDGERCRDTLSKLFALDLRPAAFPVGEARLGGHHHVPCLMVRRSTDGFDIYVFSTYAHDQLGSLLDAALEYGVRLQLHAAWGASATP